MSDPEKPDLGAGVDAALMKEGKPLAGTFENGPVIRTLIAGKVHALSGECTHLGAPLETGALIGAEIRCPWHHARFAPDSGEAVDAPAIEPLSCFEVEEAGGTIRVVGKAKPGRHDQHPTGSENILIVGGGAAGPACADMLARADQGGRATILSAAARWRSFVATPSANLADQPDRPESGPARR